jgi:hypothetical protein
MILDLTIPEHAYMIGFIQADGHLYAQSRNRGALSVELSIKDSDILFKLQSFIGLGSVSERIRDTNFSKAYACATWRVYGGDFREQLVKCGISVGKKSETARPPRTPFSLVDYLRGFSDGDGSLGLTATGLPFWSLVTSSQAIADCYGNFIFDVTGLRKVLNRNKRDGVFNISVFKEDSQAVVKNLYYEGCFCMDRKRDKAKEVVAWKRPAGMVKRFRLIPWSQEDDAFIENHEVWEAVAALERTKGSVTARKWRLYGPDKNRKES